MSTTPSGEAALRQLVDDTSHYSAEEVAALSFAGPPPDAAALSRQWHAALREAADAVARLPREEVGRAVLTTAGELFRGSHDELEGAATRGALLFHPGRLGGALPRVVNDRKH